MMNPTGMKLSLTLTAQPAFVSAKRQEGDIFSFRAEDGRVACQIFFDFREEPLLLEAQAKLNDQIELVFLDHRLELYVNGALCDEEWPAGRRFFDLHSPYTANVPVQLCEYTPEAKRQDAVIGTFRNAEGWKPDGEVFVGDCMPYVSGGRYHVLYLKDRRHHKSKWGLGAHQWAHISTEDFVNWDIHPMALEITKPEEGSICTGSWISDGEREYLFYTIRTADRSPAKIWRSVSRDGFHFERDEAFSFSVSGRYDGVSLRDPKVIRGEDGLYHMFVTTSLTAEQKGCLAHLISRDLNTWQEEESPIYISPDWRQPECPDYISYGGKYYLLSSLDMQARYLYSDRPFGPWKQPTDPVIPCESVPKGAVWNGSVIFAGFRRTNDSYGGTMTFTTATADQNGELIFTK